MKGYAVAGCELSVIIPTYTEGENLTVLVPRVAESMASAGLDGEIVIVDDDSPDRTAQVCAELAEGYRLRLEVRIGERGLASAVLRGMEIARGDIFLVMDGDGSHPPESISQLMHELDRTSADMVLGSRYVAGGSTDEDWGLFRRLNSWVACVLARPLTELNDPMAGFFAIRRTVIQRAETFNPIGYKIALELVVRCRCEKVVEVPIAFQNRRLGSSKMTLREQGNYLRHLGRLYVFKYPQIVRLVKFSLVGATGMIVDLGTFAGLSNRVPLVVARAVAISIAMSWNFVLNRQFTFRHASRHGIVRQYVAFCLVCLVGAAVNWSVSMLLIRLFDASGIGLLLAAAGGVLAGTTFNFLFSIKWVFSKEVQGATTIVRAHHQIPATAARQSSRTP